MQNLLMLIIILVQLLIPFSLASTQTTQPYCYKNFTETTYKLVTKTRLKTVNSKNFFKKLISKKDTQIETYEDLEPVHKIRLQRYCCEGYKMTEYDRCEPQCFANGCPKYSKCVEPEVCECLKGYFSTRSIHDGKHICEPICVKPCPENSECVRPNECACKWGYYQEDFKCLPLCNGCENGRCVAKNRCKCNFGFSWNYQLLKCEFYDINTSTYTPDFSDDEQVTNSLMQVETDIENFNTDIDISQVFEENIEVTTTEATDEYDSTIKYFATINRKCPDDHVLHNGQCFPLKFASKDLDCWQNPCLDKNAMCLENGTCACQQDFILLTNQIEIGNSSNYKTTIICLTPAEFEARIQEIQQNHEKIELQESTSWIPIFFIVLGVLIIAFACTFFGVKLFFRQTGEIDVEGKSLACTYKHNLVADAEKSAI